MSAERPKRTSEVELVPRDQLRKFVLDCIAEKNGARLAVLVAQAKKHFGVEGALDRQIDRALQHHRSAGRVRFDTRKGWQLASAGSPA